MKVLQIVIIAVIFGWCFMCNSCSPEKVSDEIIAPNVFTPNGKGNNDVFEVTATSGEKVFLEIFTRAGVLVFSIKAERCRWDGCSLSGQQMANGVYYYTAEVVDSSPKISKKGCVYLYR